MPDLQFDVTFPFPASRLEIALGLSEEPVMLREYAIVIEAFDTDGDTLPKGILNWGFSAPLKGCYQYVPDAPRGGVASIPLPVLAEAPIGSFTVRIVPWRLQGSSRDPFDAFNRLVVAYSAADAAGAPRFTTVRRSIRG
ncbi:hypothetical protein [Brachybacterium sp. UNK5269]|uniref:hypothetical protein n=1 Tax=Brachybacterium sp. UNK5269 TaxID=3408576 RepID=UPI003BB1068A